MKGTPNNSLECYSLVFLCAVGKNCIDNSVSYRTLLIFAALDMSCSAAMSSSVEAL
jgi:hypothetical protein